MSQYEWATRLSVLHQQEILIAYQMALPPIAVSTALGLRPMTVIREYVRLDDLLINKPDELGYSTATGKGKSKGTGNGSGTGNGTGKGMMNSSGFGVIPYAHAHGQAHPSLYRKGFNHPLVPQADPSTFNALRDLYVQQFFPLQRF